MQCHQFSSFIGFHSGSKYSEGFFGYNNNMLYFLWLFLLCTSYNKSKRGFCYYSTIINCIQTMAYSGHPFKKGTHLLFTFLIKSQLKCRCNIYFLVYITLK